MGRGLLLVRVRVSRTKIILDHIGEPRGARPRYNSHIHNRFNSSR